MIETIRRVRSTAWPRPQAPDSGGNAAILSSWEKLHGHRVARAKPPTAGVLCHGGESRLEQKTPVTAKDIFGSMQLYEKA